MPRSAGYRKIKDHETAKIIGSHSKRRKTTRKSTHESEIVVNEWYYAREGKGLQHGNVE